MVALFGLYLKRLPRPYVASGRQTRDKILQQNHGGSQTRRTATVVHGEAPGRIVDVALIGPGVRRRPHCV
jgi:hypothetical protein